MIRMSVLGFALLLTVIGCHARAPDRSTVGSAPPPAPAEEAEGGGGGGVAEPPGPAYKSAAGTDAPRPSSPGVKAGFADDNLAFNAFLAFLEQRGVHGLPCNVSHRIVVQVRDRAGLPLPDALVAVTDGGRVLLTRRTYADGRAMIFPSESAELAGQSVLVKVSYGGKSFSAPLAAGSGKHRLDVRLDLDRTAYQQVPLDIAFVLDTTGSMGDEIARLKKTLKYINFQISHLAPRPSVRFGMVLFKDKRDEYRTRLIPFTADVKQFQASLDRVSASGGGDRPEDVQEGLRRALVDLKWRPSGAKLAFLIGDAAPHLDYGQPFTYVRAMQQAAQQAIKITSIGASGLDIRGELVWRQLAQYTMAPFVFLTRGEKGDSEGSPSTVSHHVGSNWIAENLDAIIIRMVKVELANYSPRGAPPKDDYFSAGYSETVKPDLVLQDLFRQSVKQLVSYSVWRIAKGTPTVVLPVQPARQRDRKLAALAGRLETRLSLGLAQAREFQLLERASLSKVIKLQSAQLSDRFDSSKAVQLGKLTPAKLAVLGRVEQAGGKTEVLIKLVRLETGEILSLSLLKIEDRLLGGGR